MILHLRPDLVKQHDAVKAVSQSGSFEPAQRAWTMLDRSQTGHIGAPAKASARKGEDLLDLFSRGVSDLIQRVIRWNGESWEE
jgi:creatinine amidohydrolase/Fe(II)-dependent formamide hydrolase-like protein